MSRWLGAKAKDVRARLGMPDSLPNVAGAVALLHTQPSDDLQIQCKDADTIIDLDLAAFETKRKTLATAQRAARADLDTNQKQRRAAAFEQSDIDQPHGLRALWQRVTGQAQTIGKQQRAQRLDELDELDREEQETLIQRQLYERRTLQAQAEPMRFRHALTQKTLNHAVGRSLQVDPMQPLILPVDEVAVSARLTIQQSPETILELISDKNEFFTRNDIVRRLGHYIEYPVALQQAVEQTLQSDELVLVTNDANPRYTTRTLQALSDKLREEVLAMDRNSCHGVASHHVDDAISHQNSQLQNRVGASLSDEQDQAIRHIVGAQQLSVVVGLAGAGKSTMLAAAHQAWTKQGCRVIGAAIAGKAADGLQTASGIDSRTLASWMYSWKNGKHTLNAGDVLVLDEAGMVGTHQMVEVVNHVTAAGAKLVLVGDPEQLQPINAGTPLRNMTRLVNTAELSEIRRQSSSWQRQASVQLARGHISAALAAYDTNGDVHRRDDQAQAIEALARDYLADERESGVRHRRLALAHRRVDVHKINQTIRSGKQQRGDFEEEHRVNTAHGLRSIAVGDRLLLTKNDRDLNVRNGMIGSVESIGDEITVPRQRRRC
ncbi:hypothetical protein AB833_25785 [Chromatiales bacterium (ex Bugula neritina AB1)]|nr:hypothetical protein AB833_25785 [Chromatiales bacterium (ex Bugula neritina AB1)]